MQMFTTPLKDANSEFLNSNFCKLGMDKGILMKLSGIIALVSLCVNLKGHGHGVKMRVATPFLLE